MNIKETLFEKLSKTLFKQSYKTCLLYKNKTKLYLYMFSTFHRFTFA